MTEKLVSAAIKRNGRLESRGFKSHWEIRAALGDEEPTKPQPGDEEGFMTSEDRFVDRNEAQDIAVEAKQLRQHMGRKLLSSDLDW